MYRESLKLFLTWKILMTLALNRILLVLLFYRNLIILLYWDSQFSILFYIFVLPDTSSCVWLIDYQNETLLYLNYICVLDLKWLSINFSVSVSYSLSFTTRALKELLQHRIWLACLVWWILLADWLQFLIIFSNYLFAYVFMNSDWITTQDIFRTNDFFGKAKFTVQVQSL